MPQGGSGNLGAYGADGPSLITFDGGARAIDGHRVAAGAAIAWECAASGWIRRKTRTRIIPQ
eukprot:3419113-Lingulodinium_polyedra.AAC.1